MTSFKVRAEKWLLQIQKYSHLDLAYLGRAGFWSGLDFILSSILGLALTVFFANLLSRETYGVYRYILSLLGTLEILTLASVNDAVTRTVAQGHEEALDYGVKLQLRWNLIYLAAVFSAAGYYFFQGNKLFTAAILIVGVYAYLKSALWTCRSFWLGKKDFRMVAIYSFTITIVHILTIIATLFFTKNILVIFLTDSLSALCVNLFFYQKTKALIPPKKADEKLKKDIFGYSLHGSVIKAIATLAAYIDKLVLFQFLGPAQLAVYSLAAAAPERIKGLSKILVNIAAPKLAERSLKDIEQSFNRRMRQGLLLGLLLAVIYVPAAPLVFKYLMPRYLESVIYSQWLSIIFVLSISGAYAAGANQAQRLIKIPYISSTISNIFIIGAIIIGGAFWGITGVVLARAIGSLFGFLFGWLIWKTEVKKMLRQEIKS